MIFIDCETYSATPIRNGTYAYTSTCEVMLVTWATDDQPVQCWDVTADSAMPRQLRDDIEQADIIVAHNAMFDRRALLRVGLDCPITKWRCNMVKALAHGLPGSLDALSDLYNLGDKSKLKDGKALIRLFCCPAAFKTPENLKRMKEDKAITNKQYIERIAQAKAEWKGRATAITHPQEWSRFIAYAKGDIEATRALWHKLPSWNTGDDETALWHLDQVINDRGFCLDTELISAALVAVNAEQDRLKRRVTEVTDGQVISAAKVAVLCAYLAEHHGVYLKDMTKATIDTALKQAAGVDETVYELLNLRRQTATTSTSKYKALAKGAVGGRLSGTIQFDGAARTRRAAGRTFQPQNLPSRGLLDPRLVAVGIDALKDGTADLIFDDMMKLTSSTIRGCIVPTAGNKLVVSDLSNIEGRVLVWCANEEWKLQAFRDYDAGIGADLYVLAYAKTFGVEPEAVGKPQRQIGKVLELACIAEGQLVLTDHGLIPIEEVKLCHRVWDGVEWVTHGGVVYRGEKEVITHDGLTATREHIVFTTGGEMQFGDAARSGACLVESGAGGAAVRVGDDPVRRTQVRRRLAATSSTVPVRRVRGCVVDKSGQPNYRKIQRVPAVLATSARAEETRPCTNGGQVEMHQPEGQGLPELRRAGNSVLIRQHTGGGRVGAADTRCTAKRRHTRPDRQQRALRAGEPTFDIHTGAATKQAGEPCSARWVRSGADKARGACVPCGAPRSTVCRRDAETDAGEVQRGRDSTSVEYSELQTKRRVWDILNAGPRNRFTVSDKLVHNCGYAGGVGAFVTFAEAFDIDLDAMADNAIDNIPDDVLEEAESFYHWMIGKGNSTFGMRDKTYIVCDSFKRMWRAAHPNVVALWKGIENGCLSAIGDPGKTKLFGRFKFRRIGHWLRVLLPSGRSLCYPHAQATDGKLSYMGTNQYTRKWERLHTHGGKLVENICQSVARDVLYDAMPVAEKRGYQIVLHVHDELVTEVPDDSRYSVDELSAVLSAGSGWTAGMPLAAAGFEGYRYGKD